MKNAIVQVPIKIMLNRQVRLIKNSNRITNRTLIRDFEKLKLLERADVIFIEMNFSDIDIKEEDIGREIWLEFQP